MLRQLDESRGTLEIFGKYLTASANHLEVTSESSGKDLGSPQVVPRWSEWPETPKVDPPLLFVIFNLLCVVLCESIEEKSYRQKLTISKSVCRDSIHDFPKDQSNVLVLPQEDLEIVFGIVLHPSLRLFHRTRSVE